MTANIELLPLPEADDSVENRAQWPIVIDSDVWLQKSVQDYARACVAHAAEPLKAEIERLRAEVEADLREAADALEAAWEDAERYRWLRDEARTNRAPHIFQYPAQSFDRPQYPHFKDVGLDAAIDAAREARNG